MSKWATPNCAARARQQPAEQALEEQQQPGRQHAECQQGAQPLLALHQEEAAEAGGEGDGPPQKSRPGRGGKSKGLAQQGEASGDHSGSRTPSITWITPLAASMSAWITVASLIMTLPSMVVMVIDWPCTVSALSSPMASSAITWPATTW